MSLGVSRAVGDVGLKTAYAEGSGVGLGSFGCMVFMIPTTQGITGAWRFARVSHVTSHCRDLLQPPGA